MKLPKVLIIDVNAWRDDSGSNTLRDIFSIWDKDKLALIYTSSQLPSSNICENYFQISEQKILKSILNRKIKPGKVVDPSDSNNDTDALKERELYIKAHKKHSKWLRLAREIVWKLGKWKSKNLIEFVRNFNPDVIFVPIFPLAYMGRIQSYIIKITNKPFVCYLADDNYSYNSCKHLSDYLQRFWTRQFVGPLARACSEMFVIVEKEKEDTDKRFGTDSIILTKSIDFSTKPYIEKKPGNPLKFVYTGSLNIGRDRSLAIVAEAINSINNDYKETKAELRVYSQTLPNDEILSCINNGACVYCGSVPHQEIQKIQEDADVLIFAEALTGKEINAAQLSFSTKITDYMSNGKCILAIGKSHIAPIDYFNRNDSAIIATEIEDVKNKIKLIIDNPLLINEYGRKAYDCAVRNHEKSTMNNRLIDTIKRAIRI